MTLLANGDVLACGGRTMGPGGGPVSTSAVELFSVEAGSWATTDSMGQARIGHSGVRLADGRVLVAGGFMQGVGGQGVLASAEIYDPFRGSWSFGGNLNVPRANFTAAVLFDGRVLIAGGGTDMGAADSKVPSAFLVPTTTAEIYDPDSGTWTLTSPMLVARNFHTSTALPDGSVLVAGGDSIPGVTETAERFDPRLEFWSPTGTLRAARWQHDAVALSDGKVMVVGGQTPTEDHSSLQETAAVELYDDAAATWSAAKGLSTARWGASATRLHSGSVLVAGGIRRGKDGRSVRLASAELYDVGFGSWHAASSLRVARAAPATLLIDGTVLVVGGDGGASGPALASTEVFDLTI